MTQMATALPHGNQQQQLSHNLMPPQMSQKSQHATPPEAGACSSVTAADDAHACLQRAMSAADHPSVIAYALWRNEAKIATMFGQTVWQQPSIHQQFSQRTSHGMVLPHPLCHIPVKDLLSTELDKMPPMHMPQHRMPDARARQDASHSIQQPPELLPATTPLPHDTAMREYLSLPLKCQTHHRSPMQPILQPHSLRLHHSYRNLAWSHS